MKILVPAIRYSSYGDKEEEIEINIKDVSDAVINLVIEGNAYTVNTNELMQAIKAIRPT